MQIVYSARSSNFPDYLPGHKSVPGRSCVALEILEDDAVFAVET